MRGGTLTRGYAQAVADDLRVGTLNINNSGIGPFAMDGWLSPNASLAYIKVPTSDFRPSPCTATDPWVTCESDKGFEHEDGAGNAVPKSSIDFTAVAYGSPH